MAESCASSETQGSSLCGLQMTCSSDITSSLKKQLHHGSQETMLDDSLLHLDNPELKCGSGAGYKHTSDNGYSENSLPMDVSLSEKCIDSCKTPGSLKTDKGVISSKESSTLLPSPPLTSSSLSKSSLSSAFMISSLLSTKAVSSFTTILTQACSGKQSQQLKIMNSTTNCDALQRTTTESSTKVCETKQNTLSLKADSQNELGNVLVHNLKHSKGILLPGNTGQLEGAKVDTEPRTSAEIHINENSVGIVSALRTEDAEDMQVEETSSLTVKDPVLGADMINSRTVNEPGASISELKIKKMVDGQSVSAVVSNLHSKADVLIEDSVPDQPDEMQAQNTIEDVLLIDESAGGDNADCVLESNPAGTCVGTVDVTKGLTLLAAADLNSSEGCSPVKKSCDMSPRENSGSLDVCLSKDTVSDDKAMLDYSVKSHQSDISDNSVLDISDVENTQIQAEVRLDIASDREEEVLKDDAAQADQSLIKGSVQHFTVAEPEALQNEAHKHNLVAVTSLKSEDNMQIDANSELGEVNMSSECEGPYENTSKLKANLHSTNMSDCLVICSETNNLNKETEVQLGVSLGKKELGKKDRLQETDVNLPPHETNSVIVGNPLVVTKECFNNQDKAGNKVEENKAASCSSEKVSFKNILFMPKDIIASKKNTTVVEESESTSTEPVVHGRSEITVNTVGEKGVTQSVASDTASSQIPKQESDMDTESSERGLDTVNERKRIQTENFVSASKRSKLDSVSGSDDKVVKDNINKLDKVVLAEKSLPSAEVKNAVKTKDEKAVLLSNEVLQSLISLRVKAFIKNQKQANIERLNLRTRGMQSASNLWKETAKHLEKSVLELTALNQKLESRKAHLIAVKRLASRTMSTQTGEESMNSSSSATVAPSSTPAQRPLPPSTQPAVYRTGRPGRPPLYRQIPSIPPPVPPPPVAAPEKTLPSNKTTDAAVSKHTVNMIDLTDDDETSRNVSAETSKVVAPQQPNHAGNKQYMGGIPGAASPANGYVRQRPQVQGLSGTLFGSGSQITQSSISGSQHLTTSNTADTQLHLVTPASSAAHQPGTANPLGSRSAVAPGTYSPAGHSNMPASSRNPVHNTPPPAVASPSASGTPKTSALSLPPSFLISPKHPAPLPSNMDTGNAPQTAKKRPPKPSLKISRVSQGIVLSWNMPSLFDVEKIAAYQLYAYQESDSATPRSSLWKKVGEVAALPLPMACTLTQFQEGNKYHFAVRAVDQYGRYGTYSDPSSIYLGQKS